MTDYAVTGKKRSGKGLLCCALVIDALREGRRVATNMDLWPENVLPPHCKATFYRLPDRPTVADLDAIGAGNDVVDDSRNGILMLDESSTFFNSRSWGDKERQPLLDWLVHSGKKGWDVYYQMQGLAQVDKQLRDTQVEYHIAVKRTDKWPIPVVTPLFKWLFGISVRMPLFHVGIVRHGVDAHALLIDRIWYRAKKYRQAYDTRQVFLDRNHPDACGLHSVLSPWHLKGRYMGKWQVYKSILFAGMSFGIVIGLIVGAIGGYKYFAVKEDDALKMVFEENVRVTGNIREGNTVRLFLSDGRIEYAKEERIDQGHHMFRVGEKWLKAD